MREASVVISCCQVAATQPPIANLPKNFEDLFGLIDKLMLAVKHLTMVGVEVDHGAETLDVNAIFGKLVAAGILTAKVWNIPGWDELG